MRSAHVVLGWVVVAINLITGLWCTAAHWKSEVRAPVLFPMVYVGWAITVTQITVGVLALQGGGNEAGGLHYFYGFLCMAAIGIVYSYRQQIEEWEYLLFGAGNLFIMGLALRAMFLNPLA